MSNGSIYDSSRSYNVKLSLCLTNHHAMKAYGEVDV
jgi:hypothetical protein